MVSLIRGLFGQALKTNDYLQFAILSRKSGNGSGIRPRMTVRDWKNASDGVIAPMIYLAVGGPVHGRSGEGTAGNMPARILRRQRRLVPGHLAFSWRETHGILASAIINRRLEMR